MAVALSTKTTGVIVKLRENGIVVDFIVAKHAFVTGRTLLIRKDIYSTMAFNSSGQIYSGSAVDTWLTDTYYNVFDNDIKPQITPITIVSNGSNINRTVFLLSGSELYYSHTYMLNEGAAAIYFNTNANRIANLSGVATEWWTRSKYTANTSRIWAVKIDGTFRDGTNTQLLGVRPALTLPSTIMVNDSGLIGTEITSNITVNVDGVNYSNTETYINVENAWKKGQVFINVGGVWKT